MSKKKASKKHSEKITLAPVENVRVDELTSLASDIGTWQAEVHAVAKKKGWWTGARATLESKLLLMHSEISEAVEELRDGHPPTQIRFVEDKHGQLKPEGVPIELADLAIRLFDFCEKNKIDLDRAIRIKHEFNTGRPYRHGGKVF